MTSGELRPLNTRIPDPEQTHCGSGPDTIPEHAKPKVQQMVQERSSSISRDRFRSGSWSQVSGSVSVPVYSVRFYEDLLVTRGGQYNSEEFSPISIKIKFEKGNQVANKIGSHIEKFG
jgi:hypothetical protein